MRKFLLLLTPFLLTGCIKQSASYYVSDARNHAISVRAEQEYVWSKHITLSIIAANLPACQRAIALDKVHADDIAVELFASSDTLFAIRSGEQMVQFDMETCTELPTPAPTALGNAVGVFRLGDGAKMQFEPAAGAPAAPATPAPAPVPAQ